MQKKELPCASFMILLKQLPDSYVYVNERGSEVISGMHLQLSAEEAIEELFRLYADDVYRYARYSLHNATDAKDAVQEVFLRALRAWDDFRGDSNVKTWLFRIARNYIYDVSRKRKVELNYLQHHKPDLSRLSVPLDTFIEVEEALGQLKVSYRQVFVLRCVEEFSVEETAETLGWSESKVRTTLHRAIKQLRGILGESGLVQMGEKEGDGIETGRHR